jgi:hypothetical protein
MNSLNAWLSANAKYAASGSVCSASRLFIDEVCFFGRSEIRRSVMHTPDSGVIAV